MLQSEKSVSPASVHLSALALKLMAHAYRNRCYGDLVANQEVRERNAANLLASHFRYYTFAVRMLANITNRRW